MIKKIKGIIIIILLMLLFQKGVSFVFAKSENPAMSKAAITLRVGNVKALHLRHVKGKIIWRSSNRKCVTVSKNGVVKARKKGKAVITATYDKNQYRCKVKVIKKKKKKKTQRKVQPIINTETEPILPVANPDSQIPVEEEPPIQVPAREPEPATEEKIVETKLYGEGYRLTQYGEKNNRQLMFYTLRNEVTGELMVIDGGYKEDEKEVRKHILELSDTVDVWILTHPHPDHMGAFNAIYQDPKGINIKDIYTVDIDYEAYKKKSKKWDDISVYDTFLNITKENENLHHVYAGDSYELMGLDMNVYNAYDEGVNELSKDICNDGAMLFQLKAKEESVLFCTDVTKKMEDRILNLYGEQLKSDYCQMGHHGNASFDKAFYEKVNPRVALFDAPDWLYDNVDKNGKLQKYTTLETRKWIDEMGGKSYSFKTSPNTFFIR